jgi:hypothetical protein
LLDKLRKDSLVRTLVVLILGLIFVDFLFALLFGTENLIYRYFGLFNTLIQVLLLVLVVGFFYGLYKLIRENAEPYLGPIFSELKPFLREMLAPTNPKCSLCQKELQRYWNRCPYCGGDAKGENKI